MRETFNRLADFGLRIAQKCVWRRGSARTRRGSYSAPPTPSRCKGEGGNGKEIRMEGRGGKGRTSKGREGWESEGRNGKRRLRGSGRRRRESRERGGRARLEY